MIKRIFHLLSCLHGRSQGSPAVFQLLHLIVWHRWIFRIDTPTTIHRIPTLIVNEGEVKAGLYDVMNQKLSGEKNMSTKLPGASLTKMMGRSFSSGRCLCRQISWNDNVHWVRSSVVGRRKNRRTVYSDVNYTLRDVFKAAMIASNNECADMMAFPFQWRPSGNDWPHERTCPSAWNDEYFLWQTLQDFPAAHAMFDNSSTPTDLLALTLEMLKYPEVTEIASMGLCHYWKWPFNFRYQS